MAGVDIAIVGAGFAGLALAARCADAGLEVAVLERRANLDPEGVALQLQPNGLSALDALGVTEDVLSHGHRIDTFEQRDADGRLRSTVHYHELHHTHPYMCGIRRPDLLRILADRLQDRAVLHTSCTVNGLEYDDVRVTGVRYSAAGNDEVLQAKLVVGADGVGSAIRTSMGVQKRLCTGPEPYLIGISQSEPEDDIARIYCGDGYCNGVLPYGEQTYFFDCVTGGTRTAFEERNLDAWKRIYAQRVPGGESVVESIDSFDKLGFLSGRTHWTPNRTQPGVVLIGDAAAAVHPHSGQGANQALIDADALGGVLAAHGPAADDALFAVARQRANATRRMVAWSIIAGRTLDGSRAGWRWLRRSGQITMRVGPFRRAAIRQQAGLA